MRRRVSRIADSGIRIEIGQDLLTRATGAISDDEYNAKPRYLTPDLDRRLTQALHTWPERLPADALLLQRATGLRIGELVDLELDSVHEIPGQGAWLKVPLGKLNTERMVPLDEETVALIDRIVAHRSHGRPLPHPRT